MSIDKLHGNLLVHEKRMQGYKEEEQALKVMMIEQQEEGAEGI